jgi:hypothetical protein
MAFLVTVSLNGCDGCAPIQLQPVHRIPVGDYLLSRLVLDLLQDAGITQIRTHIKFRGR